MVNGKQFAIKEVATLTITDYSTHEPIAYIPYATETSIVSDSSHLSIFGGKSNLKLLSWDHSKEMQVGITVPLVDMKLLAHLAGCDSLENDVEAHADEHLFSSGGLEPTITLSHLPLSDSLQIYSMNSIYGISEKQSLGNPLNENEYSIDGKVVALNPTTAPIGKKFLAMYDYSSLNDSHVIQMFADRFSKYVRITGEGRWRNVIDHEDEVIKFDFCKCKFRPNFTLTQSSTSATMLELTADLEHKPVGKHKIHATIISEGIKSDYKFDNRFFTSDDELFKTIFDQAFIVNM